MVGTSPMRSPDVRHGASWRRRSAIVRAVFNRAAPTRATRSPADAVFVDESPIDLEAEAGLVADVQIAVAQLRVPRNSP